MRKHQQQKNAQATDATSVTRSSSSSEETKPDAVPHALEPEETKVTKDSSADGQTIAAAPLIATAQQVAAAAALPTSLSASLFSSFLSSSGAAIDTISEAYVPEEMTNVVVFVNFEGNIGAGKSVLIKRIGPILAPMFKVHVREERVTEWASEQDNFLKEYYADQKAMAFKFQCNAMCDRLKGDRVLYAASERWRGVHVVLQERSRSSDRIFALANHQSGFMDKRDMGIYVKLFDMWQTLLPERTDLTYVLNTTLQHCVCNIGNRSRNGEESINIEYLKQLDALHNKYDWTYGGKQCALEIEYKNDAIEQWSNKIAGDIVYLVLGKLVRANAGKKASMSDNSMMQLCRIYMNHLRDFSSLSGLAAGSVSRGEGGEQQQQQQQQERQRQQQLQMQEQQGLTSIDGKKW